MKPITGRECYGLPEFKALCDALGTPWELRTLGMSIILDPDESKPVRVVHEYQAGPPLPVTRTG